jgi:hypothetical protein
MTVTFRQFALAIVLAISVFSAGVATGGALATTLSAGSSDVPALVPDARGADALASPKRCHSSLGPEDYETCNAQFGEE